MKMMGRDFCWGTQYMLMSAVLSNNQFVTIKVVQMDRFVSHYSTVSDHTLQESLFSLEESEQYTIPCEIYTSSSMFNMISQIDQLVGSIQTGLPQGNSSDQIFILRSLQYQEVQNMDIKFFLKESKMEPQKNKSAKILTKQSEKKNFPKFFIGDVIRVLKDEKNIQQKNQLCDIKDLSYLQFAEEKLNGGKKLQNLRELLEPDLQNSQITNEFNKFMKKNKKKFANSIQNIMNEFNSKDLKERIKEIIIDREEDLIQKARNRDIKEKNRKEMFIAYVVEYLDNLKVNIIRRKDKKVKNVISQKDDLRILSLSE